MPDGIAMPSLKTLVYPQYTPLHCFSQNFAWSDSRTRSISNLILLNRD